MTGALAFGVTVVCLATAVVAGAQAARGTYRWVRLAPALAVVEGALVVLACLELAEQVGGRAIAEPATHLAYLVVSVLVLPAAVTWVRRADDRSAGVLVALALLVGAVVVVRMQATGVPVRATRG